MSRANLSRLAMAGAMLCLALLAMRINGSISLSWPLQVLTSGDEQSSLFAVWKFATGRPVYADRFQPPYDAVLFNWLFYAAYGTVTGQLIAWFSLSEAWLPTIGRLFTLALALLACFSAFQAFAAALGGTGREDRRLALAFAILLALGPLTGFWAITVRPDVGALAFEISAIACFLRLWPERPRTALLCFILLAYCGWSFKQGNVFSMGAVGLFLLFRRRWGLAAALAVIMPALWAATLALGSPQYRANMLFADYAFIYSLRHGLGVGANFLAKSAPMTLLLAGGLYAVFRLRLWSALWRNDAALIGLFGLMLSALAVLPFSTQTGAAENYYFILAFHLALLGLALLRGIPEWSAPHPWVMRAGGIGWILQGAAILLAMSGVAGITDVRSQDSAAREAKACLDRLPRPLFVNNPFFSLPWIATGTEPFVLSYSYHRERALGRKFAHDGVGGLIARGHFAALVFSGEAPVDFDGAKLDGYRKAEDLCTSGYSVLLRADLP